MSRWNLIAKSKPTIDLTSLTHGFTGKFLKAFLRPFPIVVIVVVDVVVVVIVVTVAVVVDDKVIKIEASKKWSPTRKVCVFWRPPPDRESFKERGIQSIDIWSKDMASEGVLLSWRYTMEHSKGPLKMRSMHPLGLLVSRSFQLIRIIVLTDAKANCFFTLPY